MGLVRPLNVSAEIAEIWLTPRSLNTQRENKKKKSKVSISVDNEVKEIKEKNQK